MSRWRLHQRLTRRLARATLLSLIRIIDAVSYLYPMRKSPFEPCIPTKAAKVPDRPEWIHEIKHDGYRLIVQREGKRTDRFGSKIVCRRLKLAVFDTCLPRAGHDFCAFQMQTATRFTSDSRVSHASRDGPRVHDTWRVRASPDRACRQGRDPYRRKGRDGGERLA